MPEVAGHGGGSTAYRVPGTGQRRRGPKMARDRVCPMRLLFLVGSADS